MGECEEWLEECLNVFPKVRRRYHVTCIYAKTPEGTLGRIRGEVTVRREVDPESLLLYGKAMPKIRRKISGDLEIQVNEKLRKIENPLMRKQVVQYLFVHELLHLERKDLLELNKSYGKRTRKRIHIGKFEEMVFERFNQLRELGGMPRIRSKDDLKLAISKIASQLD